MAIAETLRSRFRPEWKQSDPSLHRMFENALGFLEVPKRKKAEVEKAGTFNARGVAEQLRCELAKDIVPELSRIRRELDARLAATQRELAALAKPEIDKADAAAAVLRQETRTYLRGLSMGERMQVLTDNPDLEIVAAALEGPPALSGLTAEHRAHVEQVYQEKHHRPALRAMEDREEAVATVRAALDLAAMEIRGVVGLQPHEFDEWFWTADRTNARSIA